MNANNPSGFRAVPGASPHPSGTVANEPFAATLLRVAWLAILLGMTIEVLLVLVAVAFGTEPGAKTIVAELVKTVAWSFLVCLGLAIGISVADALKGAPALFGLLVTPLAFSVARGLHRGASQLLSGIQVPPDAANPVLLAALRGLEYGCLGALVAWVGSRKGSGAGGHIAAGFIVGVVFGTVVLALRSLSAPTRLTLAAAAALIVNEIVFPAGCALVLYLARAIKRHASSRVSAAR